MSNRSEKLFKSSTDKHIMGVCGGLAEYFYIDLQLFENLLYPALGRVIRILVIYSFRATLTL